MKITQILLSTIFSLLLFGPLNTNAQQMREMKPLKVQDFKCLQSLECVQSSQHLKSKGWTFVFDDTVDKFARELTARMKGEHVYFHAIYDEKGNLIRSNYKLENAALPSCLLKHLAEGTYKGWQIAGSRLVVKNFDPASLKYKVILKNKASTKSVVYDNEFINDLHLKYEGLATKH